MHNVSVGAHATVHMLHSEVSLSESSGNKGQVFRTAYQVLLPSYQPGLLKSRVHILLYVSKEMSDLISMWGPWVQGSTANNAPQIQLNFMSQRMHRLWVDYMRRESCHLKVKHLRNCWTVQTHYPPPLTGHTKAIGYESQRVPSWSWKPISAWPEGWPLGDMNKK